MNYYDVVEILEEFKTDKPILEMHYTDEHEKAINMAIESIKKKNMSSDDIATLLVKLYAEHCIELDDIDVDYARAVAMAIRMIVD